MGYGMSCLIQNVCSWACVVLTCVLKMSFVGQRVLLPLVITIGSINKTEKIHWELRKYELAKKILISSAFMPNNKISKAKSLQP